MTRPYRPALIGAALLALAGCGSEDRGADQRTAAGQILPGSASDAMIHYDRLRSQNPLAPGAGSGGNAQSDAAAAVGEAAAEGDVPESPATESSTPEEPATPPPE
jgi:hypothetical protein